MFTEHLGEFTGEILQVGCEENSHSRVLFNKHPGVWNHRNTRLISYVQCYSVSVKKFEVSARMSLPELSSIMSENRPPYFHFAVCSFTLKFNPKFVAF